MAHRERTEAELAAAERECNAGVNASSLLTVPRLRLPQRRAQARQTSLPKTENQYIVVRSIKDTLSASDAQARWLRCVSRGRTGSYLMAIGDFAAFREDLLIAIARGESIGSLIQPKAIADKAGLIYKRGWVGEAVRMLQTSGLVSASFSIGDPDAGVAASITGTGWEEAERLAERRGQSIEEPPYTEIEENAPQWTAAQKALDETHSAVKGSNEYATAEPEDQKQRIAELESGKRLLWAPRVRLEAIKPLLISALRYLATKFADNAIGIAATAALVALLALLGIHL
jgi:hypothetical protein